MQQLVELASNQLSLLKQHTRKQDMSKLNQRHQQHERQQIPPLNRAYSEDRVVELTDDYVSKLRNTIKESRATTIELQSIKSSTFSKRLREVVDASRNSVNSTRSTSANALSLDDLGSSHIRNIRKIRQLHV